jgi:hypothetical protein
LIMMLSLEAAHAYQVPHKIYIFPIEWRRRIKLCFVGIFRVIILTTLKCYNVHGVGVDTGNVEGVVDVGVDHNGDDVAGINEIDDGTGDDNAHVVDDAINVGNIDDVGNVDDIYDVGDDPDGVFYFLAKMVPNFMDDTI